METPSIDKTPLANPNAPPDYSQVLSEIQAALEAQAKWLQIIADNIGRYVKNQGC